MNRMILYVDLTCHYMCNLGRYSSNLQRNHKSYLHTRLADKAIAVPRMV